MSAVIAAPFFRPNNTIVLPNPKFADARAAEQSVDIKNSMTGVQYVYKKSSDRLTLTLPFELSRMKAIELQRFADVYYPAEWMILLHDDTKWRGSLISSPLEFNTLGRAGGRPGGEQVGVTLELSAIQV